MRFSTDFKALCRSHAAVDVLAEHWQHEFCLDGTRFDFGTAWWLAELSRWAYGGKRAKAHERQQQWQFLANAGLEEIAYIARAGAHCSVVQAINRRFAVLVFRGTSNARNWLSNATVGPLKNDAHRGYECLLDHLWPEIAPVLKQLDGPVFITGHSLGGALAVLAARRHTPEALYTFGAPPVGNRQLQAQLTHQRAYRVTNYRDLVTRLPIPGKLLHVGELHYISWNHSVWRAPDASAVCKDQEAGQRQVTRQLNRAKWLALPEILTDHAPQNYVAHMARHVSSAHQVPPTVPVSMLSQLASDRMLAR